MITCTSCGGDVTGKKFCPDCGSPVRPTGASGSLNVCPRCNKNVKSGAAFCMHCGSTLSVQIQAAQTPPPPRFCPSCRVAVSAESAFCTSCGQSMYAPVAPQAMASPPTAFCTNCGRQNAPGVRFCASCGSQLGAPQVQVNIVQSPQYPQQQYPQQQYPQQYVQGGYQPQPMMGQPPMVLHCPTCMAIAPMGTPSCLGCRTSLAGIVPVPANMPVQSQQGSVGGFLQGNGGKYAMGALGGAAAVIGGEMLLHGLENTIENRVEDDMGYGEQRRHHHHHHHREEGGLGGLGELAKDIGLF